MVLLGPVGLSSGGLLIGVNKTNVVVVVVLLIHLICVDYYNKLMEVTNEEEKGATK